MHPSQVFATNPSAGSHGAFTPALEQLKATAAQHTTTGTTPTTGSGARPLISGLAGEKLSQQLSDKLTHRGTGGIGGSGGGGGTSLRSIGGIGGAGTALGTGSRRQGSVADFEREHNLRALLGPQRGLPSHSFGAWSLLPEHVQKQFPQAEFNKAMSHARRELRAGTFVADSPVKHAIAEYFFRKEGWDV
ncbi:hypothetical protein [Corynebacterium argentoratense]|uniref:hypothetical protein n=1 Tax=Corynebacterium argentoratense TaxID=42817 RepID=UPI0028E77C9F|nr:hypothetical protein [Corynebacterium argentoratense]